MDAVTWQDVAYLAVFSPRSGRVRVGDEPMSADNWAQCPRCTRRGTERLEARETAVQALYGTVPVNEFDDARRELQAEKDAFARRDSTFREDYEISGAETGVVTVSYSGSCWECKLELKFYERHQIEGIE